MPPDGSASGRPKPESGRARGTSLLLMKKLPLIVAMALISALGSATLVPKGTDVRLAFDQGLSSKTAKVGDRLAFEVVEDVIVDGKIVVRKGAKATGVVERVQRGRRFGVNASIRIKLDPIGASDGTMLPIAARYKGKKLGGGTDKAAMASGAGALVLGPIGLGVGYFMTGREVTVRKGDTMMSEVAKATEVNASGAPGSVQDARQGAGRP